MKKDIRKEEADMKVGTKGGTGLKRTEHGEGILKGMRAEAKGAHKIEKKTGDCK